MPTIKDVARRAGVSIATVSRTLNKPETVRADTRELVQAAIDEMGYRPNGLAQSMRQQSSRSILAMVPDIANPFFAAIVSAAQVEAAKAGYRILLMNTANTPASEDAALALAETRLVDGILQLGERQIGLNGWYAPDIPVIHMCEGPIGAGFATIAINNVRAMEDMVAYLISLGHRRFGFVTGPENNRVTRDRICGARRALEAAGITTPQRWISNDTYNIADGEQAFDDLMREDAGITAVCCFSDHLAVGAIAGAARHGKQVPGDISITGFDDVQYARHHVPPLTTIAQPQSELGNTAISSLFALMNGTASPADMILPHELVVRQSAAPLR